eukprot:c34497_g1_i1 orf=3-287(-)
MALQHTEFQVIQLKQLLLASTKKPHRAGGCQHGVGWSGVGCYREKMVKSTKSSQHEKFWTNSHITDYNDIRTSAMEASRTCLGEVGTTPGPQPHL